MRKVGYIGVILRCRMYREIFLTPSILDAFGFFFGLGISPHLPNFRKYSIPPNIPDKNAKETKIRVGVRRRRRLIHFTKPYALDVIVFFQPEAGLRLHGFGLMGRGCNCRAPADTSLVHPCCK